MPFAPNKNATELGIDKSRKFRVVGFGYPSIPKGTIIKLVRDDYTRCPKFCRVDDESIDKYFDWYNLEYADDEPKPKFKVGDKVRCINKDGNLNSELEIGKVYTVGVSSAFSGVEDCICLLETCGAIWSDYQFELVSSDTFRYTPTYADNREILVFNEVIGYSTISHKFTYSKPLPSTTGSEPKQKKTFMQTLSSTLKRVLNPQMQSMYKAGLIDGDLALTDKGTRALLTVLLEKYETELANIADEIIKEEEKSCK